MKSKQFARSLHNFQTTLC